MLSGSSGISLGAGLKIGIVRLVFCKSKNLEGNHHEGTQFGEEQNNAIGKAVHTTNGTVTSTVRPEIGDQI